MVYSASDQIPNMGQERDLMAEYSAKLFGLTNTRTKIGAQTAL